MFVFLLLPLIAVTGVTGQNTPAPPGPMSYDPNCTDKMDTCWKMPKSNCEAPYVDWAKEYCANRCGYCNGKPTPAPACVNKLPNCESYDKSVCTDPDYVSWAGENCRYFCRMCDKGELARLDSITTTIKPEDCVDKVDCRQYGANACSTGPFKAWSDDNCPRYCKLCTGIPTPPPVCEDKIPNCKAYNPSTCTDPQFKLWVADNCQKFCGLCAGSSGSAPVAPVAPAVPVVSGGNVAPPLVNSQGKDSPTISYITAAPPLPGKRATGPLRSKRQFHASHHHHSCMDGSSTDPRCNTAAPTETKDATTSSLLDSIGFPGSEFHPNHKPDNNWDSKPSTTSVPTTTTTAASTTSTTESTTTHATPPIATNHATPTRAPQYTDSTTTAPPTVTNAPTTTTAPPTVTAEPTTTTAPPTVTEGPTTTTAPPTTNAPPTTTDATTTTTSLPETPSTTVLAVKTPGLRTSVKTTQAPPNTTPTTVTTPTTAPPTTSVPSTSSTVVPTTTATTTVGTTAEACKDTVDNCAMYGKTACESAVYRPWAKAHCSVFCGFCQPVTLTPFRCQDKLANCKEFDGGDLCTADSYFAWSRENCFAYCGFPPCGNNTGIVVTTTQEAPSTAALPKSSSDSNCTDVLDGCILYPDAKCLGIYEPWARSNCAYRCGYCDDFLPCEDVNPDCDKFPPESCIDNSFTGWARQNCRKYCNMCARPTSNPAFTRNTGTMGTGNTTHPTPEIPHSSIDPIMMTTKQP